MCLTAPVVVALRCRAADWHHWQDVLVGSAIGHVAAYCAFRLRFPSPFTAAGVRLVPHVVLREEAAKQHRSPPAVGV